ncbi:TIR domain-containing protein [Streptomyces chartreusis]
MPHWFFTGYSDDKNNLPLVERFHKDVEQQVGQMLGNAVPGSGFVDFRDIRPGERWEDRIIASGVCTAQAMLALYSPSYFQSHWCAHEWTVFNARLNRRAGLGESPFLVGVLWQAIGLKVPEPAAAYQYVRLGASTKYEQRGLMSIVPRGEGQIHQEYEDLVHEVAKLLVEAHSAALAPIRVEDIATLRPEFGAESSLPIDYVLAYDDRDNDRDWGRWAYSQLHHGHGVDVLPAECFGRAPSELLRTSLLRARRLVVLLSRDSLTGPCLHRRVLEEIYADPDLKPDLPRLVPVFIDDIPPEEVPTGLPQDGAAALYDIPDPMSQREILLTAVNAPVRAPTAVRKAAPAYPAGAVSPFESRLVDKLSVASSLIDPDVRSIWFEATGFGVAEEPKSNLPTRPWLLAVVRIARKLPDGYERLALALKAVGSELEAIEVRKLIDDRDA